MANTLAAAFASCLAAKDHAGVQGLLHREVDFRAMTPGRVWEADGPEDVLEALRAWFDDGDVIEAVEEIDTFSFADLQRVGYRFRVRNEEGLHLVEQQAYLTERDGRIGFLRMMCSGYRPID